MQLKTFFKFKIEIKKSTLNFNIDAFFNWESSKSLGETMTLQ